MTLASLWATRPFRYSLLALVGALLPGGCGSSGDQAPASQAPTCEEGQFRLQGTLGDQSVDLTESSAGGELTPLDSGELQTGGQLDPTGPTTTALDLTWAHGVVNGSSTDASGTLVMTSGPFAGQTLCVGQGTRVTLLNNDMGVTLQLAGFASGASCDAPIVGALSGCWR
jgi:hypothetical protein